jgi:CRP-like cAMP-binding protein
VDTLARPGPSATQLASLFPRTDDEKVDFLAALPIFASVGRDELAEIAPTMRRRSYRRREIVFREDDPPASLYFIIRGLVRFRAVSPSGRELTTGWCYPGGFFGVRGTVLEDRRRRDAIAVEACDALTMPAEHFNRLVEAHPPMAMVLIRNYAARLNATKERLYDMAFRSTSERLAKSLYELVTTTGDASGDLTIHLNQHEIASVVGTTRESVGVWLKFFASEGWITYYRGEVRITDLDAIRNHFEASN